MQNRTLSTSYLVLSTIFAALSISTAYMFGLAWPLQDGLITFLDSSFFADEFFRLTLGLVGVSAFSRLFYNMYSPLLPTSSAPDGATLRKKFMRYGYLFLAYLIIAVPYLLLLFFFLDKRLVVQFLLSSWFFIFFAMFAYVGMSGRGGTQEILTLTSYFSKSVSLQEYVRNPILIVTNLTLAIFLSVAFGYFRIISLSLSHPYCIATDSGVTEAAIIGKSEDGLLVARLEEGDWVPITLPMGMPLIHSDVYGFINKDRVVSVNWTCEKSPMEATTGLKQ